MTTSYISQFSYTEQAKPGFQYVFWEIILWFETSLLGKGAVINTKTHFLQGHWYTG